MTMAVRSAPFIFFRPDLQVVVVPFPHKFALLPSLAAFSYQSDLKLGKGSSTVNVLRVAFLLKRTNTLKNPINALGEGRIKIEIL